MARARTLVGTLCLYAALSGCGSNDVYVMFERFELKDDERVPAGAGCEIAIPHGLGSPKVSSQSGTASPAGDFAVSEQQDGDAFLVVVSSNSEEIERRRYSEKRLLSGKHDTFMVTTHAGHTYELSYWGGHDCDTSHLHREDAGDE